MNKVSLAIIIGGILLNSALNGMFANIVRRIQPGRTYISKSFTPKQLEAKKRKDLREERDLLSANLIEMEQIEKKEYEKLGVSKAYSNACIRYATKERARVQLENVKEQLSKKVPSVKEAAQLKTEKIKLEEATKRLESHETFLKEHNPWKWYNDYDFVTLPKELNRIKINTIDIKLAKFQEKQQKKSIQE